MASVTIKDVAREAHVSVATVSRVFSGSEAVRPETARRIREVAARHRYVPHGAARSLITRKTTTLGVVLPDLHGEFFSEVIRGMDQTAQRHGYHLLLTSSHGNRAEAEAALRAMRGRVDGLIAMSPHVDTPALVENVPAGLPVMLLNCAPPGKGSGRESAHYDTLNIDNERGARAMVQHLLALGHRSIAIIGGAEGNFDAAERLRGYRRALREAAIVARSEWEVAGDFTQASGFSAAKKLLGLTDRPTAVFAANDAMAIGALSAVQQARLRVPEDLAVAGFDDIPLARFMSPPLSTVHVAICELGERAAATLVAAIDSNGQRRTPVRERIPTRLIIRRSCGSATPNDGA
ncbi:MAG: LacI family DNA-binding transcriptional regulator [Gemmatimonadaceae bacterium]